MKRFSFSILIAGMLLVSLLGSCKKDNTGNYKVVFKANVQQPNSGSKTSIQPDGSVLWSSDDAIKVYNGSAQSDFTLINGAGSQSASFGGDIAEADTYYGAYPASAATFSKSGDNKVVTFTLPETQQVGTSANDFDPNVSLMVAASNTQSFSFKNVFGILALSMKSANGITHVTKFELTAKNNDTIWGSSCSVTLNDDNTFAWNGLEGGTSSITLTCDVTLTETPQTFYILVPPVTMGSGLWLKIYNDNADGEIYSLETSNPVTIGSNQGATFQHEGQPLVIEPTESGPLSVPLTLEAQTDGEIVVYIMDIGGKGGGVYPGFSKGGPGGGGSGNANRKYSVNNGVKTLIPMGETTIPVNDGDKVQFYGNGTYGGDIMVAIVGCPAQTKVYGNIMSMIDETGYATRTTLQDLPGALAGTFYMNANLTDASGLLLPATTLSYHCYGNMFAGCTSLTTAPTLPATTLASDCYSYMFYGCTNLVTAPTLPATTLADYCYDAMFSGCTSLTAAPELPVETLASGCYAYMFNGCTSLTTAPTLPATTLDSECYYGMFSGCTSLTTAPVLPATTLANWCYANMFNGCTSLTTAPTLPATTLANSCYRNMFQGCSSLNSITCLATEGINENYSTNYWVDGVASTGTFNRASGATWPEGANGIPNGWTLVPPAPEIVDLTTPLTLKALTAGNIQVNIGGTLSTGMKYSVNDGAKTTIYETTTIPVNAGDKVRFYGNGTSTQVYGFMTAVKLQGTAQTKVYGNIMSLLDEDNFATLTALPDEMYVFGKLFSGNANLTDASGLLLPATTLAMYCYYQMFLDCTALTAAPALPATTLANSCYDNMFKGCSSLTAAPALPATTLKDFCYYAMFQNCSNLNSVTCLATSNSANQCTTDWLSGVAATGTFIKASGVNWTLNSSSGIPSGWTVNEQ